MATSYHVVATSNESLQSEMQFLLDIIIFIYILYEYSKENTIQGFQLP